MTKRNPGPPSETWLANNAAERAEAAVLDRYNTQQHFLYRHVNKFFGLAAGLFGAAIFLAVLVLPQTADPAHQRWYELMLILAYLALFTTMFAFAHLVSRTRLGLVLKITSYTGLAAGFVALVLLGITALFN